MSSNTNANSSSVVNKGFLGWIARVGNKLPNPFMLFAALALIVLVLSYICSKMGVSVTYMAASAKSGDLAETTVFVNNLVTKEFFREILRDFVKIYVNFAPLGTVMVAMLGIGYVQDVGFFDAFIRKTLLHCPPALITFFIALVGICANISGNAGIIISTTLAAAIYASLGRNPVLRAILGYACGHGGFTANLMVTAADALLSSITKAAADSVGIDFAIGPLMNYFFMVPATLLMAGAATFVTEFIMPRYVETKGKLSAEALEEQSLSEDQRLRQVDDTGADFCPDVRHGRNFSGADADGVPHRGYQHESDCPDKLLRPHNHYDNGEVQGRRGGDRHRQHHFHDASLQYVLPCRAVDYAPDLDASEPAAWPLRAALDIAA